MITQKKFIKKYIQLHPNVTKKYALKKYKKARLDHFGTTNKKRTHSPDSNELSDSDVEYDDLRNMQEPSTNKRTKLNSKTLEELLHEHNIDSKEFDKYAQNQNIPMYPENYEEIIKNYLEAVENGEASPVSSLSPEQRNILRKHHKCKLYKWMNEIAPNDQIPEEVNILTDCEGRYFYMYEGMEAVVTNKMIEIMRRHNATSNNNTTSRWINTILKKELFIIDPEKENNEHFSEEERIQHNDAEIISLVANPYSLYAILSFRRHAYFIFIFPADDALLIVNPHGTTDESIFNGFSNNFSSDITNKFKFTFCQRDFNEQSTEGSCTLHSFARLIYVAYNMRNKEYNMENLLKYLSKKIIPCQYAIFAQNLKYIAEQELGIDIDYNSELKTISKIDFNEYLNTIIHDRARRILNHQTKNPYVKASIDNYRELYNDFMQEVRKNTLTQKKIDEFEKITEQTIRRILSSMI